MMEQNATEPGKKIKFLCRCLLDLSFIIYAEEYIEYEEVPSDAREVTVVTSEEFFKNAPSMIKDDELPTEQTIEQIHQERTEENIEKINEYEQEVILTETDKKYDDENDEKILQDERETAPDSEFEGERSSLLKDNEEDENQELKFIDMEYAYEGMEDEEFEEEEFEMDNLQEVDKDIEEIYVQPFYKKGTQDDDDTLSEEHFNIFGEPRASQLGPVVTCTNLYNLRNLCKIIKFYVNV